MKFLRNLFVKPRYELVEDAEYHGCDIKIYQIFDGEICRPYGEFHFRSKFGFFKKFYRLDEYAPIKVARFIKKLEGSGAA